MKKLLCAILICTLLVNCGSMGVVSSPSNYSTSFGKQVSVEKTNANILGINAMDAQKQSIELLKELEKKCSNGVTNIITTSSFKSILIVIMEKLEITGNCK